MFVRCVLCLYGLAISFPILAQSAAVSTPPDITPEQAARWNRIENAALTPNGRWLAYLLVSDSEVTAVIRSTRDSTERRYPAGQRRDGVGGLNVSQDGTWISFLAGATQEPAGASKRAATDAMLVNVESGALLKLPNVRRVTFLGADTASMLLERNSVAAAGAGFEVTLRKLGTEREIALAGVEEWAANPEGTRVATATPGGLSVCDVRALECRVLDASAGARYKHIVWSSRGSAVAVVRRDARSDQALLALTRLDTGRATKQIFATRNWAGFPTEHEISDGVLFTPLRYAMPTLLWRADERGLFFGVRSPAAQVAAASTTPNLVLWHWQDDVLPDGKPAQTRPRIDLSFVSLEDGRYIRLGDESLRFVEPQLRGQYSLAYDKGEYGWLNPLDGRKVSQKRDYYLVDVFSGQRRILKKGLVVATLPRVSILPRLTPDGRAMVYQDENGDFIALSVLGRTERNLTAHLPTKFVRKGNDPKRGLHPVESRVEAFMGWASDGQAVLLSDFHDVWWVPLNGSRALNLTAGGPSGNIEYEPLPFAGVQRDSSVPIDLSNPSGSNVVDVSRPIYFSTFNVMTGESGIAVRDAQHGLRMLHIEDAHVEKYLKAREAGVFVAVRTTLVDPDYYLLDRAFAPALQLTNANPERGKYRWPPRARYLSYTNPEGGSLHALLYLPAGYEPGKRCPMITWIYELQSGPPGYVSPSFGRLFNWLQSGYCVLYPDIAPRFGDPGQNALQSVMAAVEAAVGAGIADRERLGITGHSMGGYETYYIVSQTDAFKAAVPEAGVTNLWSFYGGVLPTGESVSTLMETFQPYLGSPWWQEWSSYLMNSPLYHAKSIHTPLLMVHGDRDREVPLSQALELFSTLRRMGSKPAVLLQYVGEGHVYSRDVERDIDLRVGQFFDHFLKDAPAPDWWTEGKSYPAGRTPTPH